MKIGKMLQISLAVLLLAPVRSPRGAPRALKIRPAVDTAPSGRKSPLWTLPQFKRGVDDDHYARFVTPERSIGRAIRRFSTSIGRRDSRTSTRHDQ